MTFFAGGGAEGKGAELRTMGGGPGREVDGGVGDPKKVGRGGG